MNVAVTSCAELIFTTHGSVPMHPPPDQPANVQPGAGVAVRVTTEPGVKFSVQVPLHELPEIRTVPPPLGVETVSG
jgi:hypothetical protein